MMAAEFVQVHGHIGGGQCGQLIQARYVNQNLPTDSTKDIGEGLETTISIGFEEQETGKAAFFPSLMPHQVQTQTGVAGTPDVST